MRKTLKEITDIIGGEISGDPHIVITGLAGIEEAAEGDLTFLNNPKFRQFLQKTNAAAIIIKKGTQAIARPTISVEYPSIAFGKLIPLFFPPREIQPKGIHPTAILGKDVNIGKDISIGPYVVIGDNAVLGDRCTVCPHVTIGYESRIGSDTVIYSNASIREKIIIGDRVKIFSGAVIGQDGFGFDTAGRKNYKVPQIGNVIVEDDVEIGANVTIDRARLNKTVIGAGTKIDNHVQIAHNVIIGKNCLISAHVGISGSSKIGNNVIMAGQVGISGHLTVGDNAILGGQAGVTKSVPANTFVSGYPARPHSEARRINAYVKHLPELNKEVKQLKEDIKRLQTKKKKDGKSKNYKKRNRS